MKKVIFLLSIISFQAYSSDKEETYRLVAKMCDQRAKIAEMAMWHRQMGFDLSDMLEMSKGKEIAIDMFSRAYKLHRYSSIPGQEMAIERFKDDVETQCIRDFAR